MTNQPTTSSATQETQGRYQAYPAPQRVAAIVMPTAGKGAGQKVINQLRQRNWDSEVKVFALSTDPDACTNAVAGAYHWGADRFIASGGDGTVARVVTAMLASGQAPLPIAIVPAGTGNVVAVDLGLPDDIEAALQLAFRPADVYWWDVGRMASGEAFLLRASAGHDARTLSMVNRQTKKLLRNVAYAIPGAYTLLTMQSLEFQLEIDDQPPITEMGVTAFAAVSSRISGPWPFYLSAKIRPDDGMLYAGVMHLKNLLIHLPRILKHRALEYEGFDQLLTLYPVRNRVTIRTEKPQRIQVDGDLIDYNTPFTADVVPHAVPFVVRARRYRHHTAEYRVVRPD